MKSKSIKTTKIIAIFVLLLITIGLLFPTWTPAIKSDFSISTLKQVNINGTGHEVMIRGVDKSNPIIIFVHGGPGCSEIPYVRKYQQLLEDRYTIVHYDQRGSGKSYHFNEDYSNLITDVLVDDLLALTDVVTKELGQEKVLLVGHSFGTYIGMKAAAKAPEKFLAYVGIGQVSDHAASERDSLVYTLEQAKQAGNSQDVETLESLRGTIESGKQLTPRDLVRKYGGAARLVNDNQDYYKGFLLNPEYNLLDVIRYLRGVSATQELLLKEEAERNITEVVTKLDIPVYFVMGKYDYMTSVNAALDYYNKLEAPAKDFIVFPNSAHYPQFEEKESFAKWLNEEWGQFAVVPSSQLSNQNDLADFNAPRRLLASIADREIHLFSEESDGVVLSVEGKERVFDWLYMTPRGILPRMQVHDYDGDGKDELAIILYTGSGTGISVEELRMVELDETQIPHDQKSSDPNTANMKDHIFNPEDYLAQIEKAVNFRTLIKDGKLLGEITIGNEVYTINLQKYQSADYGKVDDNLVFGNIVGFSSEDHKLKAEFGVGISVQAYVSPEYIGYFYADVNYKAGQYTLSNFRFEENQE